MAVGKSVFLMTVGQEGPGTWPDSKRSRFMGTDGGGQRGRQGERRDRKRDLIMSHKLLDPAIPEASKPLSIGSTLDFPFSFSLVSDTSNLGPFLINSQFSASS